MIGEEIDSASENLEERAKDPAPFCTWDEIKEMSLSGTVEIVSHSYEKHRYNYNGHRGANIGQSEEEEVFFQAAKMDFQKMDTKLKEITGKGAVAFSYPYSYRSDRSDRVWMECGYDILFAGDDDGVRSSCYNYYVDGAGINYYSALTRRITRMTGTPIRQYIEEAIVHDQG